MTRQSRPRSLPRVKNSAALLAAIPVTLGYWPTESAVIVVCREKAVELSARVEVDWFVAHFDAVADQMSSVVMRYPDARYFLLGYSSDRELAELSLAQLAEVLDGCDIVDMIATNDEVWWSMLCDESCCPPEGRPFDRETAIMSAEAVFAGLSIGGDRESIVARVAGPAPSAGVLEDFNAARIAVAGKGLAARRRLLAKATCAKGGIGRLAALKASALLQDDDLAADVLERLHPDNARAHAEWLMEVVDVSPPEAAATPLGLLGLASWLDGGGPVMTAAAERLVSVAPRHPLAGLLHRLLTDVVPPWVWRESA